MFKVWPVINLQNSTFFALENDIKYLHLHDMTSAPVDIQSRSQSLLMDYLLSTKTMLFERNRILLTCFAI